MRGPGIDRLRAIVDGWHGDAAVTVPVGDVAPELLALAGDAGFAGGRYRSKPAGARVGDVGRAVSGVVEAAAADHRADYGVVIGYTGHGIGTAMHMPPDVPNYGRSGTGPVLQWAWPSRSNLWSPWATRIPMCSPTTGRCGIFGVYRGTLGAHRRDHRGGSMGVDGARWGDMLTGDPLA